MHYGAHTDAAYLQLPGTVMRSDLSCTIFLNDPESYEGGALRVYLGDASISFKLPPVSPSSTHRTRCTKWSR
jgi:PKHD-type hydroxylase